MLGSQSTFHKAVLEGIEGYALKESQKISLVTQKEKLEER